MHFLKQILMSNSKRYTITAALPYTNGPVHIGHLAGVYVPADIYARFLRATGNDHLVILVFLLIIIQELQQKFITKQLQNFLRNYTMKESLLKNLQNNCTMQKQISF